MTGGEWHNPLHRLLRVLESEARELTSALPREKRTGGDTPWAWRKLPRGALVAARMIVPPEDLAYLEVRIARPEKPEGDKAVAKWEKEIDTFVLELELTDPPWERLDGPPETLETPLGDSVNVFFRERQ